MDSILTSIKEMLGIEADCTDFDGPIIAHINTVLMLLSQNGVGPEEGFIVTSEEETWSQIIDDSPNNIQAVKTYVYCKVKFIFDPPQSSSHLDALKQTAAELEWRLNIQAETNI
jgi:hypothetical protein